MYAIEGKGDRIGLGADPAMLESLGFCGRQVRRPDLDCEKPFSHRSPPAGAQRVEPEIVASLWETQRRTRALRPTTTSSS
jgi:hypothetical protein